MIADGRTRAEGTIPDLVARSEGASRYRLRLAAPPPSLAAVRGVGRIRQEGETWMIELEPGAAAETVWPELFGRGWKIVEIRDEGRGLESFYLSLTGLPERKAA